MWKTNSVFILQVIFIILFKCIHVNNAENTINKQKICIIGAGSAGLATTKHFAEKLDKFEINVFEKQSDVGGLWIYSDSTTVDEHNLPVHSSMYKNLRTNFPKNLMSFPDYKHFNGENHSIVHRSDVLQYLRNYTNEFNLRQHILFDTLVERVLPVIGKGDWRTTKWHVFTMNLNTNTKNIWTCDSVVVCNGHFVKPRIPTGIDSFTGKLVHSHLYRFPEPYAGKIVVILGEGFSGRDIALEISKHAIKVYLSHNHKPIDVELPSNIIQIPGVIGASGNELILKNDSKIEADVLILCTGYLYDFPFLTDKSHIKVDDNQIQYLYKHIVNVEYPTMGFVGVPNGATFYLLFNRQAKFYVALMDGKVNLPSKEDMLKDCELKDTPKHKAHTLNFAEWGYYDDLATLAGFEKLDTEFYRTAVITWGRHYFKDFVHFRDYDFVIYENGTMAVIRKA